MIHTGVIILLNEPPNNIQSHEIPAPSFVHCWIRSREHKPLVTFPSHFSLVKAYLCYLFKIHPIYLMQLKIRDILSLIMVNLFEPILLQGIM